MEPERSSSDSKRFISTVRTDEANQRLSHPMKSSHSDADPENSRPGYNPKQRLPDYSSRSAKLRLFVMVCAVMLVVALMFEARNPRNWDWLGFLETEPEIETSYLSHLANPQRDQSPESPSTGEKKTPLQNQPKPNDESELERAQKRFWDAAYKSLNLRQRVLLLEGLYLFRNGQTLPESQASEWLRMIEEFSVSQDHFQSDIVAYISKLSERDEERGRLSKLLFELKERWDRHFRVLEAIGNREETTELSPELRKDLTSLQLTLDRSYLDFVKDNSLQSVKTDQPAMYRLLDILREGGDSMGVTQQKTESQDPEKVQFIQLYKETNRLRGRSIRFEGEIRGAYSMDLEPNYLGINKLYVFWVLINGAQNPTAVYTLNAPADFVIPLDQLNDSDQMTIKEPVEVRGILFQKMVYAANDRQRIAPVVFASGVNWKPVIDSKDDPKEIPGLTGLIAICLSIGGCLALGTWWFTNMNQRQHLDRIKLLKEKLESAESVGDPVKDVPKIKIHDPESNDSNATS